MFDPSDTFPYIGLRPFSEDDSLYFKGRDEQILQLTALLEANKFLMVTGASGDGKSSLVYAGLIPNARAGFFKAKHPNWVVADFRPERSPLLNLSKTVSKNLRIGNEESVEVELRRGFSSLVELYTTSSLNIDEKNDAWMRATEDERDLMQRNAANLLIVADQFEEFFTNPENYYKNSPSADSQLVINLLLETARISTVKNLPIYIVCTMRSDYIGQCAAFRGLPEFIGFSQFFVPRLKRKEMVQVVKEPAFLHGDKITNRLAERVVYDLGEGIDQLPVLEHAMNEVWIQAKHGHEELDLIHYAMAGGMAGKELPVEDQTTFEKWFNTIPIKLQEAYQHPGLSQIIDTHANKLFLSAADHYNQHHASKISAADAQLIIKVAFTCLTKMDEDRAVRNRMTLQEITNILDRPKLTHEVVGGVLNIFRETGNTFLRPYITDDPESRELRPESVLDITHESLIRNWELLLSWAQEEYDHLTVYEDFKKQLDRWLDSGKSKGFLLPIGPLTFFENWHTTLSPNKYWVNRYLDPGIDKDTRLDQAQQSIEDTNEFLERSARNVRVTRMVVKYGASRIAAVLGSILILALCGFYYQDAQKKKNENVIKTILTEGSAFISDPRFENYSKADFLIMSEFMDPGSYNRIMDKLPVALQFDLIRGTYWNFMYMGGNPEIKKSSLHYGDSVLRAVSVNKSDPTLLMERLEALNTLVMTSSHYLYSYQDEGIERVLKNSLIQIKEILPLAFSQNFDLESLVLPALDDGIENVVNNTIISKEEAIHLLSIISPFEGEEGKETFTKYFPVDKHVSYSRLDLVKHNGGYQQLAYLYGYLGNIETVKACVDSLLKYHPNYSTFRNNIVNIATYLFKGGFVNEADDLLAYYALKQKISKKELYELWLNCSGYKDRQMAWKMNGENHNINLELLDFNTVTKLFDQYYAVLQKEYSNPDDVNFNLALYYKHRGVILSKIDADKGGRFGFKPDALFEKSVELYQKVPVSYRNQTVAIFAEDWFTGNPSRQNKKRSELFLYPDHVQKVINYRTIPARYYTDKFIDYVIRSNQFSSLYNRAEDLSLLNDWVFYYNRFNRPNYFSRLNKNYTPLSVEMLRRVDSLLSNSSAATTLNSNLLRLILIDEYLGSGKEDEIEIVYRKLDQDKFKENLRQGDPNDQEMFAYRMQRLTEYLALKGRKKEALAVIRNHPKTSNRIRAYAYTPIELLTSDSRPKEEVYVYLDSAMTEFSKITDFFFFGEDPRISMILTVSQIGGKEMNELAQRYVSKISIAQQSGAVQNLILGTTISGDYHQAYSSIPEIALIERLFYFNIILSAEGMKRTQDSEWSIYFNAFQKYWKWEVVQYEPEIL